jgi:alkanesulfonate monooxygenase SsuD/methylene tetrahydromethanopterin reductase-like flavin-dependent oxidoreductase (luciferase family)
VGGRTVDFGLWYDFRNPSDPESGGESRSFEAFYAGVLEQIAWAEQLGFDSVWLSEHHFCADGYAPSPLVIAAAIGARTERMKIGTNLMLLPLHDPIRIAEDTASLAILTGGRFRLGVGLGYRQLEYDAFGRSLRQRPSLLEESVAILRRAWSGESIAFAGKRFRLPDVHVTPLPEQPPELLMGGLAEPAIERVARLADGFLATGNDHHQSYVDACARCGRAADAAIYAGQWVLIDRDPEATWARVGDRAVYQLNRYIEWGAFGPPDQIPRYADRDAVVAGGAYELQDPALAIERLTELIRARPQIRDLHFWAQLPGEPVESGSRRLELIAREVLPEVRKRIAGDGA